MMVQKNYDVLMELLHDMEAFAILKNIYCPPIYLLGGSGCIVAGYFDRATVDIDLLDMNYQANIGRLFNLLEPVDVLDQYLTTVAPNFEKRARKISGFKYLEVYVLSREDIITTKIGRYSEKDIEDIRELLKEANKKLISNLINEILARKDISHKIKEEFYSNSTVFKEEFNV